MIKKYTKKTTNFINTVIKHFFLSKFKNILILVLCVAFSNTQTEGEEKEIEKIKKNRVSYLVKWLAELNNLIKVLDRLGLNVLILKIGEHVDGVTNIYYKMFESIEGLSSVWIRKHPQIEGWTQVIIVYKSFFKSNDQGWLFKEIEAEKQKQFVDLEFKWIKEEVSLFEVLSYDLIFMGADEIDYSGSLYLYTAGNPIYSFMSLFGDGFDTFYYWKYESSPHKHLVFRNSLSFVEAFFVEKTVKICNEKAYIEQENKIMTIQGLKHYIVDWACATFPKQSKEFSKKFLLDCIDDNDNFLILSIGNTTFKDWINIKKKINGN